MLLRMQVSITIDSCFPEHGDQLWQERIIKRKKAYTH